jgi:hypothetical protein
MFEHSLYVTSPRFIFVFQNRSKESELFEQSNHRFCIHYQLICILICKFIFTFALFNVFLYVSLFLWLSDSLSLCLSVSLSLCLSVSLSLCLSVSLSLCLSVSLSLCLSLSLLLYAFFNFFIYVFLSNMTALYTKFLKYRNRIYLANCIFNRLLNITFPKQEQSKLNCLNVLTSST